MITLLLLLNSLTFAKPQELIKACPIVVLGSADGKTETLPTMSSDTSFNPHGRAYLKIIVRADVIREDQLAHGEVEKQKDIPLNAYPFISKKIQIVCGSEVSVKYFVKSEEGKDYYLRITGENNHVYKEFTKRLNGKTEDSESFNFKAEPQS